MKNYFNTLRAVLTIITLVISTTAVFFPILFFGLCKLIPIKASQAFWTRQVDKIVTLWCDINNFYIDRLKAVNWEMTGLDAVTWQNSHLVIANHQSWLDIVVLQRLFNRKIPVLKFFIKDQLKWMPLLGFSWWAMGCPFMKRYTKDYLEKHPHKRGKDLKATIKALRIFQATPATITSFVEGTRFTQDKSTHQKSPFTHLLKPKAGGISFVIGTMGEKIQNILDVTIVYDKKHSSLWDFLCNRMDTIKIHVRALPIPTHFCNTKLMSCETLQAELREWLNERWGEKDAIITNLSSVAASA